MKKLERDSFYSQMEDILPNMSEQDQSKIVFVKTFLSKRFQVDDVENSFINIERLGTKTFLYLLFTMIVEYENRVKM
jgi:hypothetical protein